MQMSTDRYQLFNIGQLPSVCLTGTAVWKQGSYPLNWLSYGANGVVSMLYFPGHTFIMSIAVWVSVPRQSWLNSFSASLQFYSVKNTLLRWFHFIKRDNITVGVGGYHAQYFIFCSVATVVLRLLCYRYFRIINNLHALFK